MKSPSPLSGPTVTATGELLVRVVSSPGLHAVGEEIPIAGRLTIGRDPACDILMSEPSVSRFHATIEPTPQGVRIVDLDSENGLWVSGERVKERILEADQRFRIESTVFACVHRGATAAVSPDPSFDMPTVMIERPRPSTAASTPAKSAHPPFLVDVVEGVRKGAEYRADTGEATVGRGPNNTIVLEDRDVSRRHLRIESSPEGFLIVDAGSTYGVWVGSSQVRMYVVKPDEPFRLSQLVTLKCRFASDGSKAVGTSAATSDAAAAAPPRPAPSGAAVVAPSAVAASVAPVAVAAPAAPVAKPPAAVTAPVPTVEPAATPFERPVPAPIPADVSDADFGNTVVMHAFVPAPTRGVSEEGELFDYYAHKPILLDDPEHLWYVVSGGVLIFTVALENGQPTGTRSHFLGILPEQCFFGFDVAAYGLGSAFLAVAKNGTKVRKISRKRLRELAADPVHRAAVAGLVDTWVSGLSKALVGGLPLQRSGELRLQAGQATEVGPGDRATAADAVLWVE